MTLLHFHTEEDAASSTEGRVVRACVEMFQQGNPDLELEEEVVGHDVYETKLKTLAAADELPDVFISLPTFMPSFYDNGQIQDIRPYIDADPDWSGRFAEGALGDHTFGELILASPRSAIINHLLLWNTDIFRQCGIESFPADTEEFTAAVQALKDNGYVPMAAGNKGKYILSSQIMPGVLFKFTDAAWYENLKSYGGASFTDPEPLAAITYMDELIKLGLFNEDFNSLEPGQARQVYYREEAAMYIEGSWVVSQFISEAPAEVLDKTDITLFPVAAGKESLQNQMIGGQGWGFCLSTGVEGETLRLCLDFLKRLTSPEASTVLIEGGALAVNNNNIAYDADKVHPFYQKFLDTIAKYDTIVGCPEVQLSAAYMDASYTGYQELSIGALTPQQLAEKLQAAHEEARP